MKTARQQQRRPSEASTQSNVNTGIGGTRAKTSTKRTGGRRLKITGKDRHPLLSPIAEALCEQLPLKRTCLPQTTNNEPTLILKPGQTLLPVGKIKLQLFPIDEVTCKGLEKDGHNPHLELTLSDRKKISSVLRHLNSKWGSSSTAVGELMLLPYNSWLENLAGYRRWTLKDNDTSAADVYAAIGRPAIFRLRYGWFSNLELKTFCVPLKSSHFEECSLPENIKKGCSTNVEIVSGEKQPYEVASQEYRPISISDTPNAIDNLRTDDGLTLSSSFWADSLANISIGGLLSEASLHAAVNRGDQMRTESGSCLQQISFSSDSFDAAIAAHILDHSQGSQRPAYGSHSSILDAEETCHAFSFQKFSHSGKDVLTSSKSTPGSCSQDVSSKSFKFPNLVEANTQALTTEDHAWQEPKADLPPHTQGDDSIASNLGMTNFNWSDSLGPLDLGLSSSRQLFSGDSISFSNLLASSLDAFQSCSLFPKDGKVA